MKKYIGIIVLVLMLITLSACGKGVRIIGIECSGELITKEYTDFVGNELIVRDIYTNNEANKKNVNFYTHSSKDKKIVITAQQEVIDSIKVSAKNNEIVIAGSKTKYYDTESIKIELYGYKFEEISLENASGEIDASSVEKDFELNISNVSNIKLTEINGNELDANVSGASILTLYNITESSVEIEASGASTVNSIGAELASIDLNFSGTSKGTIYTHSNTVEAELSGASSVTLNGFAEKLDVELSGSSSIEALEFKVDTCEVEASGASVANVNVTKTIMYSLSGASLVQYKGKPEVKATITTGGSQAKSLDE